MKIAVILIFLNTLNICCLGQREQKLPSRDIKSISSFDKNLHGVFSLILEETNTFLPEKKTTRRDSAEWVGIWIFKDGYYSMQLMPKKLSRGSSEGTWAETGRYKIEKSYLRLAPVVSSDTTEIGRVRYYKLNIKNQVIKLIFTLTPHIEDTRKGYITIQLKRLTKPSP